MTSPSPLERSADHVPQDADLSQGRLARGGHGPDRPRKLGKREPPPPRGAPAIQPDRQSFLPMGRIQRTRKSIRINRAAVAASVQAVLS
jgi:hypothetical protein